MKKDFTSIQSILFIVFVLLVVFGSTMPYWSSSKEDSLTEFSTNRALELVKEISKKPHYIGSENHEKVAQFLLKELQDLGLKPTIQEGFTLTDWGNLVKSKNIIARIKGTDNSKALLLLSHYDSAPHSNSYGASDDASGVATILEGVRAFLHSKKAPKNDIIILFTDAEELGLNGAALFVTKHSWAKEIGLVVNFEARGTSGTSFMFMETTNGNSKMVEGFKTAKPSFPATNSLYYSIYKMLPNDTDLTVFREQGKIQGFNFAFIDSHYNYHTQQDDYNHLDENSLRHQGSYLMPLLHYFSNSDLSNLKTTEDDVYFNIPFSIVSYPFSWVLPMVLIALGTFVFIVFIGIGKRILTFKEIFKGFIPLLVSLFSVGLITYFGWKILKSIYPQYQDLLNGFTYNGYEYIGAFSFLSLVICLLIYNWFSEKKVTMDHYVAPLFLWLIINLFIALKLKGAGYFIIPVFFGLLSILAFVLTQKSQKTINLIFSVSALIIFVPLIQMLPVGLGLGVLFVSSILTVLTFGLLLPVFGEFTRKSLWTFVFFLISVGFFAKANYNSGYEKGRAKSNSLLYYYNSDTKKANWATYDVNLDTWTKTYLGENPKKATIGSGTPLFSKYNSRFTYESEAPIKNIAKPTIQFLKDSISNNNRYLKIKITPNRKVNRYDIFANKKMDILNLKANGVHHLEQKGELFKRKDEKLLSYYVVNNEPLILEFNIKSNSLFDMNLLESSFDLMSNPMFKMKARSSWMMPTPFVLNDAVVIQQKIKPTNTKSEPIKTKDSTIHSKDTIQVVSDSIITLINK